MDSRITILLIISLTISRFVDGFMIIMHFNSAIFGGCVIMPFGRAPGSQSGGHGFDPHMVHHGKASIQNLVLAFFIKHQDYWRLLCTFFM